MNKTKRTLESKTDARIVFPEPAVLQVVKFESGDKSSTYGFPRPKVLDDSPKAIVEIGGDQ